MGELDLFSEATSSTDGAWCVADVTRRARQLIESGFSPIWVRGEVSGFKAYRSGHWYFTLRDADAQVRCIMWRSDNQQVRTPPDEGVEVFVEARPTVWEDRGEFRLTVKRLLPTAADGEWQVKLEQARAALDRDGLFDPSRKRPLPRFPFRIAVVTSVDGAALRDIVAVTQRRWPVVELLVVPTRVQGEGVEAEIRAALQFADRLPDVDLVIVGRGGGRGKICGRSIPRSSLERSLRCPFPRSWRLDTRRMCRWPNSSPTLGRRLRRQPRRPPCQTWSRSGRESTKWRGGWAAV